MLPDDQKQKFIICLLVILALAFVMNYGTKVPDKATSAITKSEQSIETVKKLGINFQTFRERYNEQVSQHEEPQLLIKKFTTKKENGKETIYCYFGSSVGLGIDIDKDTNLLEVTVFSEPEKGGREAGYFQGLAFQSIIAIFDPQFTKTERNDILRKFVTNLKRYAVSSDKYRYESRLYNGILMFSVKPRS